MMVHCCIIEFCWRIEGRICLVEDEYVSIFILYRVCLIDGIRREFLDLGNFFKHYSCSLKFFFEIQIKDIFIIIYNLEF